MHDRLLEQLARWNNDYLREQYRNHRDQYTPAALELISHEMTRRGIVVNNETATVAPGAPEAGVTLQPDECVPLSHPLHINDTTIAAPLLREAHIPFLMTPVAVPGEALTQVNFLVRPQDKQNAEETLLRHFALVNGTMRIQYEDVRQHLRGFDPSSSSLSGIHEMELEIHLSPAEREAIGVLGRRLLTEVDAVEAAQERVVFYYDNIEAVIDKINSAEAALNPSDMMTVLEILQIYADDPLFPALLWDSAKALLNCLAELSS
ncbi:MAG: hypothetical protein PHC61_18010 [Chitinivibrionales bacterium]|nr:hypothetical protein [Chitinivibrionales bacterium]